MIMPFKYKINKALLAFGIACLFSAYAFAGTPPTASFSTTTNTLAEGTLINVTPQITGSEPLRYAWKKNGVFLPNDTLKTFNRPAVALSDAGTYTCVVSNPDGQVETPNSYTLTVTQATGAPQPGVLANKTVVEGGQLLFTLSFTGSNPKATTWQWYKNGIAIPGANTGASFGAYLISNVSVADAGSFYCVLTNSQGTTTTNTITATVTAATSAPTLGLNGNPTDKIIYAGDRLLITANLNGASMIKWQKNGVDIPNSNTTSFTINSAALSDSGYYACVGSNSTGGSYTTATAKVTILPAAPPAIDVNLPDSFVVDEAGTFSIGILVRGTVSYAWRKNGVDIPVSGPNSNGTAQTPRFSINTPLTLADSGYYSCNVINSFGSTLSNVCKIIVVQQPIPLFATLQSTYMAGAGQARLFMKGAGAEKFTKFFIDKAAVVVSSDGRYYMPLSLNKGLHEIKATTDDGKSEVVKMVTIK